MSRQRNIELKRRDFVLKAANVTLRRVKPKEKYVTAKIRFEIGFDFMMVQNRRRDASSKRAQGRLLKESMQQAHARAARVILDTQNLTHQFAISIDLHHLHLREAENATKDFLSAKRRDGLLDSIFIVTGHGLHSANGCPVLKPAICNLLTEGGRHFTEDNPGRIKVDIG
jgi:DNA-nicking Smr family endonuclease